MATYPQTRRRGLPRRPGGEPWPPAGEAAPEPEPIAPQAEAAGSTGSEPLKVTAEPAVGAATVAPQAEAAGSTGSEPLKVTAEPGVGAATIAPQAEAAGAARTIRRGLPRVPGGEPWPPAGRVPVGAAGAASVADTAAAGPATTATAVQPQESDSAMTSSIPDAAAAASGSAAVSAPAAAVPAPAVAAVPASDGADSSDRPLRRGLPRVPGGEAWPPAGFAPAAAPAAAAPATTTPAHDEELRGAASPGSASDEAARLPDQAPSPDDVTAAVATLPPQTTDLSVPLPFTRTVWAGTGGRAKPASATEPKRIGPFTRLQWAGAVIVGGGGLLIAAGMAVAAVRWLLSLEPLQEFLTTYPGDYHLPEGAPVGFPAWLGWQHFFNVFLIVLIIRSGLRVRSEKRPSVFWSPRWNSKRKISLTLWFHQALDILWVLNGVIFVVLLFVSGQWMRIVPTSWEVFPNALSAALQYVSLDWPTENGWVNYNSLQQLAYFTTVFIAAPLAVITGVRMSGIWPSKAKTLNRIYPVEWARAVHFPVMLYFVAFIIVHVALVFATGALRNLNHMYAAQGSADGLAYADNWAGFWIFAASMVVIAAAWVAARPLVLAPIARLFGKVSGR
ncbi:MULTISPECIES: cytochrome b/b6 domain-containing protein [unclassified Microbacterium]|uniref:cytochrome b/b6 domain-containing protein n=1 Tax=unclassified Microbacterium TaxID=2609290 RepID=UPI00214C5F9C|nr:MULTISPECIES: cytochrome b/b6 domain-containing protein [unclassified Microbacterium]MCR2808653.1 cytochrome b/b6 domain-containing protein [Microbacterium sp. zg.B185]WIM18914.1 cytochrome b/b6 domain-containing protein [Microbacterium sp. zg-B185]